MGKQLLQNQTKLDKRFKFKNRLPTKCLPFQLATPLPHTLISWQFAVGWNRTCLIHYHGTWKLGLYSITLKRVREKKRGRSLNRLTKQNTHPLFWHKKSHLQFIMKKFIKNTPQLEKTQAGARFWLQRNRAAVCRRKMRILCYSVLFHFASNIATFSPPDW